MSRKSVAKRNRRRVAVAEPLKLDFGCGPNPREGFEGVDAIAFPGVKHVLDVTKAPWPWPDNSVGEFHASHFLEHLTARDRVTFFNELYRVLKPGAGGQIITPHWASCRAYGDFTHVWPPVSEFLWYYLDTNWRAGNAPHCDAKHALDGHGYSCDFGVTWNYNLRNDLIAGRNEEYVRHAMTCYREVCQDMVAHATARK